MPHSLTVLFEDNHLIAVHKPAGLLTQGDGSGAKSLLDITKDYLKKKYEKPGNVFLGLVHRLDKPVAGVVVFGRTSKGASRLSEAFRTRVVDKTYLALVEGVPITKSGELRHCLDWDEDRRKAFESAKGKEAVSSYRVLKSQNEVSLVEVKLLTGRKHQIRYQLSALGHPVLGDGKYGAKTTFNPGIALACRALRVPHPVKEEEVRLVSPTKEWGWPSDLVGDLA